MISANVLFRRSARLLLPTVLAVAALTPLYAQNSRGTILGHISDPSGAAVQGVKVTVRNVNAGVTNVFTTNSVGDYVFVDLIPGTYQLSVAAPGFKSGSSTGLILEVDQTLRQDFTLAVGTAQEEVSVNASTQMVQTDNTTLGNVLDQKTIEELPLNGRDFTNLLNLSAGAANVSGGIQATGFVLHGLSSFTEVSLNGARPDSVSYMLDGVNDNDAFFSGISNVPSEFAIQEVKVQTGLYSAEYGYGSGQVNVAIKSGTNRWHGQAYDYIQNDALDPSNPLVNVLNIYNGTHTPIKLPHKQNQFGGTLGGPVRIPGLYNGRDKTFWFFAYDGGRLSFVNAPTSPTIVPTMKERNGDFSDWPFPIYDPSTTGSVAPTPGNPTGRTAFANNQISNLNTIGKALANLYPAPNINCSFPCNNYVNPVHNLIQTDNVTMRVDENLSDKDRVFFSGHIRHDYEPSPSQLPFSGTTSFTNSQLFGLNWQHTFGTNTINEARFGYNHQFFNSNANTAYGPNLESQLGFANTPLAPALFGIPVLSLDDGYSGIGVGSSGQSTSTKHTSFQFVDNLKTIRGKHTLTAGADIRKLREFEQDNFLGIGSLTFTGAYTASDPSSASSGPGATTGNPIADMLLGDPINLSAPAPLGVDYLHVSATDWNFFFQDDIRLTPRLTVNLGLRYELPPAYHTPDNSGWTLDPTNGGGFIWASKSFVQGVEQTAAAQGIVVNPNFLRCCVQNSLVPRDTKDFAPRIGVSWRPLPTDRFVVRAGYGIFYDTYNRYYDLIQNYDSNFLQTTFPNNYPHATGSESVSPLNLSCTTLPNSANCSKLWLPPISSSQFFSLQGWNSPGFSSPILNQVEWPYNHNPYNEQWTLDTQYALNQTLLLDIGYVGSHDLRLPTYLLYNIATPPAVPSDSCNGGPVGNNGGPYFDISQVPAGSPCLTDPNFSPIDKRVPLPNVPSIVYANANVLSANYNALQVQLRQRYWNGLAYQISYAWSRAFDESSAINNINGSNGNGGFNFVQDPHNVKADYGPAAFDQPQRLTVAASYELPVGTGKRWSFGRGNAVIGGWKLSGIYSVTSGRTFTVFPFGAFSGFDEMGSVFSARYRANQSGSPTSGFTQSLTQWFNGSVFSAPPPGTYGDELKDMLRGPYVEKLDLSLGKEFLLTERQHLQFRAEMFNVGSNWHYNPVVPSNNIGNNNFGSLVPLEPNNIPLPANQWANLNLWSAHRLQFSLVYSF